MPISLITGDATAPQGDGPKVIVHVCNDVGAWGAGFVLAISRRWPEPERRYREWLASPRPDDPPFELGEVQFVKVEPSLWVANLLGQRDLRAERGLPPIRYGAIREGLARVATRATEWKASVHMPRIGCGLAGGSWPEISRIIEEELVAQGVPVTVYDLPSLR